MAITNHERVGKALELLKAGLAPFFEREIKNVYQAKAQAGRGDAVARLNGRKPVADWDAAALINKRHVGRLE